MHIKGSNCNSVTCRSQGAGEVNKSLYILPAFKLPSLHLNGLTSSSDFILTSETASVYFGKTLFTNLVIAMCGYEIFPAQKSKPIQNCKVYFCFVFVFCISLQIKNWAHFVGKFAFFLSLFLHIS